jgi:hypothetical protein
MAALLCKCGNRLSNSESPNDIVYHVYSDGEWNKILERDYVYVLDIPKPSLDVWKCNNCDRIYIFDQAGKVLKIFAKEEDRTK